MQTIEVIGRSPAMREVARQIGMVARTDATVLIRGESGTGKELVAHAVHAASIRARAPYVTFNCAAVPLGLFDAELFGHEKGAFTGAIARHPGRFEQADTGTLFLDEVAELPLEIQPKLLRILQEKEFERVGGVEKLRSDIRLVAATNRPLEQMVGAGIYREDLYYRLNVFPIYLPALRERREDIPLLAEYFVRQFARRMNKTIDTIPDETMEALVAYDWPGNIRELQNVLERAVILAADPQLVIELPREQLAPKTDALDEVSRAHILSVLEATRWTVGGPNGAAARLGLKRTTLNFRMKKLGITRRTA